MPRKKKRYELGRRITRTARLARFYWADEFDPISERRCYKCPAGLLCATHEEFLVGTATLCRRCNVRRMTIKVNARILDRRMPRPVTTTEVFWGIPRCPAIAFQRTWGCDRCDPDGTARQARREKEEAEDAKIPF